MQTYIDSSNLEEIEKAVCIGISGVTTNPTSLSKEIRETGLDFESIISNIADMVQGPVSLETMKTNVEDIVEDAINLSKISDQIVVKIPLTYNGLRAIKILKKENENIKTNATLTFSTNQAILAAKVGADYCSVFVGRLDDIGYKGMDVVRDTVDVFEMYYISTEVIVASIRHPLHILEAAKIGVDICTIPYNILEKMIEHPMTNIGIEKFMSDWEKNLWETSNVK